MHFILFSNILQNVLCNEKQRDLFFTRQRCEADFRYTVSRLFPSVCAPASLLFPFPPFFSKRSNARACHPTSAKLGIALYTFSDFFQLFLGEPTYEKKGRNRAVDAL